MEKYKNELGEKSKKQIKREVLADQIEAAYTALKNGDCSIYYQLGSHAQFIIMDDKPRVRVLLAKSSNITTQQLKILLKDCKKSQHHIARKLIIQRIEWKINAEKAITAEETDLTIKME
jgi:hypothetical protein